MSLYLRVWFRTCFLDPSQLAKADRRKLNSGLERSFLCVYRFDGKGFSQPLKQERQVPTVTGLLCLSRVGRPAGRGWGVLT